MSEYESIKNKLKKLLALAEQGVQGVPKMPEDCSKSSVGSTAYLWMSYWMKTK